MKGTIKRIIGVFVICLCLALPVMTAEAKDEPHLSKSKLTVAKGVSRKLKVKGSNAKVKWKSSNPKVATVSGTGEVTGKKVGKATIKAKVSGKTLRCKVKVTNPKLNKTNVTVYDIPNDMGDFEPIPDAATYRLKVKNTTSKVTWSSSNPKQCKVKNGKVSWTNKAKQGQVTTIYAKVDGKTLQCKVKIYATPESRIWLNMAKKIEKYCTARGAVVIHSLKELKESGYKTVDISGYKSYQDFLDNEAWWHKFEFEFIPGNTYAEKYQSICAKFDEYSTNKYDGSRIKCGVYIPEDQWGGRLKEYYFFWYFNE